MCKADFLLIRFEVAYKFIQIFGGKFVSSHNDHGAAGGGANGLKIVHWVITEIFVHRQIGGVAHVNHEQCVAVWPGAGHLGGTNGTGGTCCVVHQNLLAQYFLHGACKQPCNGIARPARSVGHDHGDGFIGVILRLQLRRP